MYIKCMYNKTSCVYSLQFTENIYPNASLPFVSCLYLNIGIGIMYLRQVRFNPPLYGNISTLLFT